VNTNGFIAVLNQLNDDVWQSVIDGKALLLVDDEALTVGSSSASNTIINSADYSSPDLTALKNTILLNAEQILAQYYLRHPLSQNGFNRQVDHLIGMHGAGAFAAMSGDYPEYTLFVEGGEVIVESAKSPRHRYGVYCEIETTVSANSMDTQVRQWLANGEAYQQYLAMNVCRYNC
jgi:hypothetical protein